MVDSTPVCQSGIYAITNTTNGKQYIGSAVNLSRRWKDHRVRLNRGVHHSSPLQRAWLKYGADAFTFVVLEYVPDVTNLIEREQHYMDVRFAATGNMGYNARPMAKNNLGLQRTAESRLALSQRFKGRQITWADKLRGRVVSDETRRKRSENAKKQVRTPESNTKRSATLKGRPKHARLTELARETRRQNAKAMHAPEVRAKGYEKRRNRPPTAKELAYREQLRAEGAERAARMREAKQSNGTHPLPPATQPFLWPDES